METQPSSRTTLTKIPGGGMMYFYKRLDSKDENGKDVQHLMCLGCGGFAATMDGVRVQGIEKLPVAIKQVSLDRKAAEKFQELEFRGLQATRTISHPNIVKYLGYFQGDDGDGKTRLSFVFERCPIATPFPVTLCKNSKGFQVPAEPVEHPSMKLVGCDLASNGIKTAPFSPREARYIIEQILRALAAFHSATPPVVHRDVKPENILVWGAVKDTVTQDILLHVKLADYNTVRRLDGRDLTVAAGTRSFMAPEASVQTGYCGRAVKPVAKYDCSADIFSAGATFFYLVSKHAPAPDTNLHWRDRFGNRKVLETGTLKSLVKNGHKIAAELLQKREQLPPGTEQEFARLVESSNVSQVQDQVINGHSVRDLAPLFPTVLDFFFPVGSLERQFLEGLVCRKQGLHSVLRMSPSVASLSSLHGLESPLAPVLEEEATSAKGDNVAANVAANAAANASVPHESPTNENTPKPEGPAGRWTATEALEWLKSNWKMEE